MEGATLTPEEIKAKEAEELRLQNENLQGKLRIEKLRAGKLEGELEAKLSPRPRSSRERFCSIFFEDL